MAFNPNKNITVQSADSFSLDAFGRQRISHPLTLFDSKQLHSKGVTFWDEETSGGTETSVHTPTEACTLMTVNLNTEYVVRQTKMRFNYMPGKSQLIMMTFTLGSAVANVSKKIGYFNSSIVSPYTADEDGLYVEQDGTTQYIVQSKTGVTTGTRIAQADWNLDKLDGTGACGIVLDWTKSQILFIDFEWLGVGRVRVGFVIDGKIYYAHEFNNANNNSGVYMSSPNHSCRYEIRSTGGTGSLEHICSSVQSEGGGLPHGITKYISTAGIHTTLTTSGVIYAIMGLRLKSTHTDITVDMLKTSIQIQTGTDKIEFLVLINPTVAGTFTYSSVDSESSLEKAIGVSANTVTGGTILDGDFLESGNNASGNAGTGGGDVDNAIKLGVSLAGVSDTIVLCARPIAGSASVDVEGGIKWRELI